MFWLMIGSENGKLLQFFSNETYSNLRSATRYYLKFQRFEYFIELQSSIQDILTYTSFSFCCLHNSFIVICNNNHWFCHSKESCLNNHSICMSVFSLLTSLNRQHFAFWKFLPWWLSSNYCSWCLRQCKKRSVSDQHHVRDIKSLSEVRCNSPVMVLL